MLITFSIGLFSIISQISISVESSILLKSIIICEGFSSLNHSCYSAYAAENQFSGDFSSKRSTKFLPAKEILSQYLTGNEILHSLFIKI